MPVPRLWPNMLVPTTHPRYASLRYREMLAKGMEDGLVAPAGLAAHGRGEAFDYLLGETTIPEAKSQARVAAAALLLSKRPVISVNGNSTVLAGRETIELSQAVGADIEVNLFHSSPERVERLVAVYESMGARNVLGRTREAAIPGIDHDRGLCAEGGIFSADTVLVLLEDGDRTRALKGMGKTVIAVDLNPLSRTPRTCDIPVVDNVVRALPEIAGHARELADSPEWELAFLVEGFRRDESLERILVRISERLRGMFGNGTGHK